MFTFTAFPKRTKRYARLSAPAPQQHLGEKVLSSAQRALRLSARYLALLVLSVLLVPAAASAQVLYGSLVGNVTDTNGAAITGAKVDITNVATGVVTTISTDDRGAYLVNDLQVGIYKVSISRASFKTLVNDNLRIEANRTYRFDAQLEVGGVEETVLIAATQDAVLQTDRADVSITKTDREINNLPLFGSLGRNYQTLLSLIPGTARGTGGFFIGNGAGEDNSAAGKPAALHVVQRQWRFTLAEQHED